MRRSLNEKMTFPLNTTDALWVTALAILAIYYYMKRNYSHWTSKNVPCEKPFPIFGNIPNMIISQETVPQYLAKLYSKYKTQPYFGIYLLERPALVLRDPELVKHVLVKNFHQFSNRSFTIDEAADPLVSQSIFAVKSVKWKALRTKLSPIFTSGKMKMMLPLMKNCCESMRTFLEKNSGSSLDFKDVSGRYATDVTSSCTFGLDTNCFREENCEFRTMGKKLFQMSLLRKLSAFAYFLAPLLVKMFKFSFLDREATDYLQNIFWETLNQREKDDVHRNDLIDILINLKNEKDATIDFNGIVISSQAVTFFSAGHETTSSTISFALYELAINQSCQDNLRAEIRATRDKYGDITYDAIKNMPYLDMVFSETLRKYTQAPFLIREAAVDCLIPEYNLRIDRGTHMIVPIMGLHSDPNYFPSPNEFNPERFSERNRNDMIPFTYLPFGNGPRNCIGERFAHLSGKMALISIIENFELSPAPETKIPLEFDHRSLLLASKGGMPLLIRKVCDTEKLK